MIKELWKKATLLADNLKQVQKAIFKCRKSFLWRCVFLISVIWKPFMNAPSHQESRVLEGKSILWRISAFGNVALFLLGTTARKQTNKESLCKATLTQGCPPKGLPNSMNRKALRTLAQSAWRAALYHRPWAANISHHMSSEKLGGWPCRWEGEQQGSPGTLPATSRRWVSRTQMQFKVYTTQVKRNNTSAGIMTGTVYNHLGVSFADLFVWWINVKMPLDIYTCSDCVVLVTQCQDGDYCEQYVGDCNTDLGGCFTDWKSTITI